MQIAVEPTAGGKLVLDQPVGGGGIGHAQKRFRQHHQRQALLGRERIGVEKILDAAEAAGPGPDRLDEASGARVDPRFRRRIARGLAQQNGRQYLVRRSIRS